MAQLKLLPHPRYIDYHANKLGQVFIKGKKQKFSQTKNGYSCFRVKNGGIVYAHRFIVECFIRRKLERLEYIDHVNRIKTDNNYKNLRITSNSQNLLNHNRMSGLSWDGSRKKWRVSVSIIGTGKIKFIGRYSNKLEAIKVLKNAKKEYGYPSV